VSPILAVVALAITVAKGAPKQEAPRDRVHSTTLRGAMSFILGTVAFLLLGMQVLDAAAHLSGISLRSAVRFGTIVFLVTVLVRIVWVFLYRGTVERITLASMTPLPPAKVSFLTAWCGIRGILTIATASALPANFPGRPLIVFAAFSVVLGTLVVQGFTIGPLVKLLQINPDDSLREEVEQVRGRLLHTALDSIAGRTDAAAKNVRSELEVAVKQVGRLDFSVQTSGMDKLRCSIVDAQRESLISMRDAGEIPEDVFQSLQEELDWAALAASPADDLMLEEI
jgi:CPA1 family monovalent cation:H+ antiporter